MLTTFFVTFTYGFELPILFFASAICFFVQFFLDKLFVTYWFKLVPVHTDSLFSISIPIMQLAPPIMLIVAGVSL